jgi:acyl carrier protein
MKYDTDRLAQEIYSAVSKILKGINRNAEVSPEKLLVEDIGLDSLNRVDAMLSLEDKLGITFPDDDIGKLNSVNDVVETVYRLKYPREYRVKYGE